MSDLQTDAPAPDVDLHLARRPAAKPRWRARYNRAMRVVRRAHLYAGLFMTPWVFLYGITALLFNHPDAFPDATVTRFGRADTAGTPLADVVAPEALAGRVVEALNASAAKSPDAPAYRLVRPAEARFAGPLFATLRDAGREHSVRWDLATGEGTVRSRVPSSEKTTSLAPGEGLALRPPPMEPLTRALPGVLGRLGIAGEPVVDRSFPPDLSFLMEGRGTTWRATYDTQTGQLTARPEAERRALSTRSYLLRLHLAHQYPSGLEARWFWALAVDAMFVSLVGWGLTGLLMWWQMKNVRKAGVVILALSAVAATAVALGMHRAFTA